MSKRLCQRPNDDLLLSQFTTYTGPCLLPFLQPVRLCLHGFVSSGDDAARFMQASRFITASVLAGYAFLDHAFTFD